MSVTVRTTYEEFDQMIRRGDFADTDNRFEEVSDTTLSIDRGKKAKLYAQAGVADYWIINIPKRCVEIRRDPEGEVYRSVQTLHRGEEARPLAFPEVALAVTRLFPV